MKLGEAHIIQGNALDLSLPDNSVDLVCTSPPYFGLRSYQDDGKHYEGQIGSEATPAEFLNALLAATREMVRVLKPTGSIFVNLGDKYATADHPRNGTGTMKRDAGAAVSAQFDRKRDAKQYGTIQQKSLIGIPWRYAIRCIDQLGLILRAEIIWAKPNGLPERVTDRVRRSHEQWFHFTKQPRYFAAVDEIREPQKDFRTGKHNPKAEDFHTDQMSRKWNPTEYNMDPRGKLPGSVWTIPTQPLTVPPELGVDHFAAYPMEWPRRIIQGWTPNGLCVECGEGRRPITEKTLEIRYHQSASRRGKSDLLEPYQNDRGLNAARPNGVTSATITGYTCACSDVPCRIHGIRRCTICLPPTTPAVVLDPFGGTGTTALVAKALGRIGISVDLSHDYCRMAVWRTNDPGELAAALQVEKPEPVPDGQVALF